MSQDAPPPPADLEAPRVGPYFALHALGDGDGERPIAAYDPEGDRKVVVVHRDAPTGGVAALQALTELSHPALVPVVGVGEDPSGAFVARAFATGSPLSSHLDVEARSVDDVVTLLLSAGFGLAALHDAGFAHRSVGMAAIFIEEDRAVLAPDGRTVHPADAASLREDQRAWSRTLCEALTQRAVPDRDDAPATDRHGQPIPDWVRAPLQTGLRGEFSDLHGLLAALEPPRPGRQRLLIGAGLAVVALAAVPLLFGGPREVAAPPCEAVASELDPIPAAPDPGPDASLAAIHDLAARWREARVEVCALAVDQREDVRQLDARLQCLQLARDDLGRWVEARASLPAGEDPPVHGLNDPDACVVDPVSFAAQFVPADAEALARRAQARAALAEIRRTWWLGDRKRAAAGLAALDPGDDPVVAAEFHALAADVEPSRRTLHLSAALASAVESGSEHRIVDRALTLVEVGGDLGDLARRVAEAAAARLAVQAGDEPRFRARAERLAGRIRDALGDAATGSVPDEVR